MLEKLFIFFILISFSTISFSKEEQIVKSPLVFEKPGYFDFITLGPKTLSTSLKMSFSKKALPVWSAIIGSTAVLWYFDEELLAEVQRMGRRLGMRNDDATKTMVSYKGLSLFRGPTDFGSTLYFLGDGWMHATIASSFLIYGSIESNNRALQTGSQILHGMIYSTIPNQILKRSFGRESPYRSSTRRGAWRPFPSFSTYNNNISKYDGMPSGHVMTATMTFTILDHNYPEYRSFIRPLAFTWVSLVGLQMMNNGVHWISDYPLGIAMGWLYGKIAASYGHKKSKEKKVDGKTVDQKASWMILPYTYSQNNYRDRLYGLNYTYSF